MESVCPTDSLYKSKLFLLIINNMKRLKEAFKYPSFKCFTVQHLFLYALLFSLTRKNGKKKKSVVKNIIQQFSNYSILLSTTNHLPAALLAEKANNSISW